MLNYNFEVVGKGRPALEIMDYHDKIREIVEYGHEFNILIHSLPDKPEIYLPTVHPLENSFTLYIDRELKPSELERIAAIGLNAVVVQDDVSEEAA